MEFLQNLSPDDKKIIAVILSILYMLLEFWLGKTTKTKSGSVLELVINTFKRKGESMQFGKGSLEYKEGCVVGKYEMAPEVYAELKIPAAPLAKPVLEDIEAKVISGQIDPIKGTDLDKEVMLKAIAALKQAVG